MAVFGVFTTPVAVALRATRGLRIRLRTASAGQAARRLQGQRLTHRVDWRFAIKPDGKRERTLM